MGGYSAKKSPIGFLPLKDIIFSTHPPKMAKLGLKLLGSFSESRQYVLSEEYTPMIPMLLVLVGGGDAR